MILDYSGKFSFEKQYLPLKRIKDTLSSLD